ncbi:MAG: tryptophan 7-halogenase [Xanthobacteraceae bacterium]
MAGRGGKIRFDVCVVGGGPAGAVAAHVLAGAGARVALIVRDRPHAAFAAGETVPAETRLLLDRLGLECLGADLHFPSAGTMARWGSDAVYCREAILNPFGCGWHLDRPLFERQLLAAAAKTGAVLIERCAKIETKSGPAGWEFGLECAGRQIGVISNFAVDCTGRAARLAIEAGARREIHDKLIAIWCIAEETGDRPDPDRRIYLESAPDGWFYSVQIPQRRRVLAYFTDGDLRGASRLRSAANFVAYVAKAFHLDTVVEGLRYRITAGPYRVNAASMKLVRAYGERWIAAGDAAQAFDPLSSQGIVTAIVGGNNAAAALIATHSSDAYALEKFQADLDSSYAAYLAERQIHYRAEQRWVERPFWQRRCHDFTPIGNALANARSI